MKRVMFFVYGVISYLLGFSTLLYLIAFLGRVCSAKNNRWCPGNFFGVRHVNQPFLDYNFWIAA